MGFPLRGDGSHMATWNRMIDKAWRAFWANCRRRKWRTLGEQRRMRLLTRAVEPIIRFYLGVVPPTKRRVTELCVLQKEMVKLVLGLRPLPTDTWQVYRSRSSRQAAAFIENHGRWWAHEWIKRAHQWLTHLKRDYERQLLQPT